MAAHLSNKGKAFRAEQKYQSFWLLNLSEASCSAYEEDLQLPLWHLDTSVVKEKAPEAKNTKNMPIPNLLSCLDTFR